MMGDFLSNLVLLLELVLLPFMLLQLMELVLLVLLPFVLFPFALPQGSAGHASEHSAERAANCRTHHWCCDTNNAAQKRLVATRKSPYSSSDLPEELLACLEFAFELVLLPLTFGMLEFVAQFGVLEFMSLEFVAQFRVFELVGLEF